MSSAFGFMGFRPLAVAARPPAEQGTFGAEKFSPACIQTDDGLDQRTQRSEDCLYLNIWSPNAERVYGPARTRMVNDMSDFSVTTQRIPIKTSP